ncbi:MAG TPA: hypothetical protein VNT52_09760 [Acidimicrobiales bacterium]|nr:hypothetical protein [Acidimicrobiales bacterium]
MFLGEYTPTLDGKGRLILPAKFREQLENAFLTSEVERCLALWPPAEFESRARELRARLSNSAGAQEVVPDKQGRIAIPLPLREFAGLLEGPVVATGAFDHVEIRAVEAWQDKKSRGEVALARQQFTGG